jgi:ribosomal-protein-alanine N-acetyltransferase
MVATGATRDWRDALPMIGGRGLLLREVRLTDAPALVTLLAEEPVARYMSAPPATVEAFEQFVAWTHRKRQEGAYACFAVVPRGLQAAVGFLQLRALEPGFETAEWGFALGRPYWGTGLFAEAAAHTLAFAFDFVGVRRLEARALSNNGRGNGALRKMGAVPEGLLRQSFIKDGRHHDTRLWSILDHDWRRTQAARLVALQLPARFH